MKLKKVRNFKFEKVDFFSKEKQQECSLFPNDRTREDELSCPIDSNWEQNRFDELKHICIS